MTTTLQRLLPLLILFAVVFPWALLWPMVATAQDDAEDPVIELEIGGWGSDTDGSLNVVSEYEPDDGGPDLGLFLEFDEEWGHLTFDGDVRNEDDQKADLDFDVRRMVRSRTSYVKLPHRLLHDPLSNLAAATNHGRIIQHTDLDPESQYRIRYGAVAHRTEIQMPSSQRFTLAFNARNQEREGFRQSIVTSHCDSCHAFSQDRPIEQRDTDLGVEARYNWQRATLRASFSHRELSQAPTFITLLFDDALQPELRIPIFDNRLQWDSAEGPQPVDATPDIDKQVARVDLQLPGWSAGGVWSMTENQLTGLSSDFSGLTLATGKAFPNRVSLRWRGRAYRMDNDEVFVDVNERPGTAGPHAGLTYQDVYDFESDFLRLSSLDRDVLESRLDVSYKLGSRKAGRVKFLWELERVDRDHFVLDEDGETKTTTNVLGVSWKGRPARGWKLDARYRHGEVDNPFVNLNGVFSTNTSERVASPFDPRADQYFDFQDGRIGEGAGSPESWDEVRLGFTRTTGSTLVSGNYTWWDGDNRSGDLTDWARTYQSASFSVWSTPAPKWEWFAALAYHDSELESPASIALFDG